MIRQPGLIARDYSDEEIADRVAAEEKRIVERKLVEPWTEEEWEDYIERVLSLPVEEVMYSGGTARIE